MSSEHHGSSARGPDGRMVDRMLFFSDVVFAIVLTIMVLELHAPLLGPEGTLRAQSAPHYGRPWVGWHGPFSPIS